MTVSEKIWTRYIKRLGKINKAAAAAMKSWVETNGLTNFSAMADYAFGLATKYGEGAAALAAEMYDAMAAVEGVTLAPAIPAATATRQEVGDALYEVLQHSHNTDLISSTVGRMSKQAGMDTALQNAVRDRAEWAWVASGDTCAFCITLASRGWQIASRSILNGGHAQHVHSNCDCMFAIRHSKDTQIAGYDPQKFRDMYESADGRSSQDRINAMRREQYAENADAINAQKRAAYAARQEGKDK